MSERPLWDTQAYAVTQAFRDRPTLDLMLRIPGDLAPREVWDLGCGPGETTALLARRHPGATVHGLDASPEMLAAARLRPEAVDWVEGDIATFAPERPADLIVSTGALHWVANHGRLLGRLTGALAWDGVLAAYMPDASETPPHRLLRALSAETRWAERLGALKVPSPVASLEAYHDWLTPHCAAVEVWRTTYLHVLEGEDSLMRWMLAAALRPHLAALGERSVDFLEVYRARLDAACPPRADGTVLFGLPLTFILARR